jgi:hypothetical protein
MTVHCQLYQWSNQALILCPLFVNEYIINFLSSNLHGAFLLLSSFKFHSTLHFTLSDELILFKYWRKTKKKKRKRKSHFNTHSTKTNNTRTYWSFLICYDDGGGVVDLCPSRSSRSSSSCANSLKLLSLLILLLLSMDAEGSALIE